MWSLEQVLLYINSITSIQQATPYSPAKFSQTPPRDLNLDASFKHTPRRRRHSPFPVHVPYTCICSVCKSFIQRQRRWDSNFSMFLRQLLTIHHTTDIGQKTNFAPTSYKRMRPTRVAHSVQTDIPCIVIKPNKNQYVVYVAAMHADSLTHMAGSCSISVWQNLGNEKVQWHVTDSGIGIRVLQWTTSCQPSCYMYNATRMMGSTLSYNVGLDEQNVIGACTAYTQTYMYL